MTDKEIFEYWDEIQFNKFPNRPPGMSSVSYKHLQKLALQYLLSKTKPVEENTCIDFEAIDYPLPKTTRQIDIELDPEDEEPRLSFHYTNGEGASNLWVDIYDMHEDYYYINEGGGGYDGFYDYYYIVPKKDFDIYDVLPKLVAATTEDTKKYGFFCGDAKLKFCWW